MAPDLTDAAVEDVRWHRPLRVIQLALGAIFAALALARLIHPAHAAIGEAFSTVGVRVIGGLQLLGAASLIGPAATRRMPSLGVLAALMLALWTALECVLYVMLQRYNFAIGALLLGTAAFAFAWGRAYKVPIEPHSAST